MRNSLVALLAGLLIAGGTAYWLGRRDQPDVLVQVQKLNQLTTVRYTIQRIITLTENKQPVGSESIVLIVQARVEAGVDLAALRPQDMVTDGDSGVKITLPRAAILNVAIDEKETKVWDRQKTWWTPWVSYSLDLEKRSRLLGLESAKESALAMGILATSQSNAEASVRSLFELAGAKRVSFVPTLRP